MLFLQLFYRSKNYFKVKSFKMLEEKKKEWTTHWQTQHKWIAKTLCWVKKARQKSTYCMFYVYEILEKAKSIYSDKKPWGTGDTERELISKRQWGHFFGVMETFHVLTVVVVTEVYTFSKTPFMYLKCMCFIVCNLFLNKVY